MRNVFKNIFVMFVMMMSTAIAHSAELDISVGNTSYAKQKNTIWWQDGFENEFKLSAPFYSIGFRIDNWRVGYADLGSASSFAVATRDEDYIADTKSCVPGCVKATFKGSSRTDGIYLTHLFNAKNGLFIEAGAWAYRTSLSMQLEPLGGGPITDVALHDMYSLGPILGIGYKSGKWSVAATTYYVRRWGPYPAIYSPWAGVSSVRYSF